MQRNLICNILLIESILSKQSAIVEIGYRYKLCYLFSFFDTNLFFKKHINGTEWFILVSDHYFGIFLQTPF